MKPLQNLVHPVLLLCFGISATALSSCSHSTSPNSGTFTWTVPSIGTMFIFKGSSSTDPPILDTFEITATGQSIGGKSNVVRLVSRNMQDSSVGFYNLEPNGDFSLGDSGSSGLPGRMPEYTWQTFPVGDPQTISDPPVDTQDGPYHNVESSVRALVGIETLTVPAGTFSAYHAREIWKNFSTRTDSLSANSDSTVGYFDIWFVPSIGMYIKETDTTINTGHYKNFTTGEGDLIKYVPR